MKANAKTYREHRIANAPSIVHELDAEDMEFVGGQTWVQPEFTVRYSVTPYRECGRPVYDVEILDVALLSAKAWFGDHAVNVPCGDDLFCKAAEAMFEDWIERVGRETIEAKCVADYEGSQD